MTETDIRAQFAISTGYRDHFRCSRYFSKKTRATFVIHKYYTVLCCISEGIVYYRKIDEELKSHLRAMLCNYVVCVYDFSASMNFAS